VLAALLTPDHSALSVSTSGELAVALTQCFGLSSSSEGSAKGSKGGLGASEKSVVDGSRMKGTFLLPTDRKETRLSASLPYRRSCAERWERPRVACRAHERSVLRCALHS
jgi:hypothetical protein